MTEISCADTEKTDVEQSNVKETDVKKVLILTLGLGGQPGGRTQKDEPEKTEEEQRQLVVDWIENRQSDQSMHIYQTAVYVLNGEETKTEFVVEPLIKTVKPDKIIIIGTARSAWLGFWKKFAESVTVEDAVMLFDDWTRSNMKTPVEELDQIQERMQAIFDRSHLFEKYGKPEVDVLVTQYGISDEELLNNYSKLNDKLTEILKSTDNARYEVSFDITHSFRSLPIYNLVILNYLKAISPFHISIEHVYYGNVEVTRENNQRAPVVDLNDLVQVLDLTNGVTEFRNTGNAVTLLNRMEENDGKLKQALRSFDLAVEMNDFRKMEKSLEILRKVSDQISGNQKGKYADLSRMIGSVLNATLPGTDEFEKMRDFEHNRESLGHIQYMISKWYLDRNRYGQSLATAMEALRSYLTPLYLEMKGAETVTLEQCKNENSRKDAVSVLGRLKAGENPSRELSFLIELERIRDELVPVRNTFAHNLLDEEDFQKVGKGKTQIAEEAYYLKSPDEIPNLISQFVAMFPELELLLTYQREKLMTAYGQNNRKTAEEKDNKSKDHSPIVRLIISSSYEKKTEKDPYERFRKSSNNRYMLYRLPKSMYDLVQLDYENDRSMDQILLTGAILKTYIQKHFSEKKIHVVLDYNLSASQKVMYAYQLQDIADIEERRRKEGAFQPMFKLKLEKMVVKDISEDAKLKVKYTKQTQECTVGNLIEKQPLRL